MQSEKSETQSTPADAKNSQLKTSGHDQMPQVQHLPPDDTEGGDL